MSLLACPECRAAVFESVFDTHFWPRVATAALPFVVISGIAWLLARADLDLPRRGPR